MKTRTFSASRHAQQGVSLFVVLMILLLSLLLVLGAMRMSIFNESIVGNQSDAQRAYAGAEALIEQAKRDILVNGVACSNVANCRFPTGPQGGGYVRDELSTWSNRVGGDQCGAATDPLNAGICWSSDPNSDAFSIASIMSGTGSQTVATAASYNQFAPGSAGTGSGAQSLSLTAQRGQYWIEVYEYSASTFQSLPDNIPEPDEAAYPLVFRITARAQGLKPGSISVLRTYYVPWPKQKGGPLR